MHGLQCRVDGKTLFCDWIRLFEWVPEIRDAERHLQNAALDRVLVQRKNIILRVQESFELADEEVTVETVGQSQSCMVCK